MILLDTNVVPSSRPLVTKGVIPSARVTGSRRENEVAGEALRSTEKRN